MTLEAGALGVQMIGLRRPRTAHAAALTAAMLLLASGATWADDAAILRCRSLVGPAERLACYEAIVVGVPTASPTRMPSTPLPSDALFGLEDKAAPQDALQFIVSSIPGRFHGWRPNDTISLTNGQRWQISDDSQGVLAASDPKVRIRRGALGAFYLEIEGTNRSPRVRRVQ